MIHTSHIGVIIVVIVNAFWYGGYALSPHGNASAISYCSDPGTPANGHREDQLLREQVLLFPPGKTVSYYCDYTYRLVGPQKRTCLADGSWSAYQPSCQKYMCDELDALPPKYGKRMGEDFTIGAKLHFKCSTSYTLIGSRNVTCLPNGQWSGTSPICEHRCTQITCDAGRMCKMHHGKPRCICRRNMDCSSMFSPVCGSDGRSYNNECIMKATSCRHGFHIDKVKDSGCLPGDRCSIIPLSKCRASFDVFYYDINTKKCRRIIAGGCHPSGWNGFFSKNECESYCETETCALKPDSGPCENKITRWYYDNQTQSCKIFKYGGCFGNSNNFRTQDDCKKRCLN